LSPSAASPFISICGAATHYTNAINSPPKSRG
jgi:hypothetical protein